MSEVKDWHRCGQCKHLNEEIGNWYSCEVHNEHIDYDDEVCSDFEPKEGWIE